MHISTLLSVTFAFLVTAVLAAPFPVDSAESLSLKVRNANDEQSSEVSPDEVTTEIFQNIWVPEIHS